MREIVRLGLKLFAIAAVAGLALGATNAVTEEPIAAQQAAAALASRQAVLPAAAGFEEADAEDIDEAFLGFDEGGALVGCAGRLTVQGFGGPIEVTVGVDTAGRITGVQVGGSDFAETAGLGAKTRDAAFTGQYAGQTAPVALTRDGGGIDAVTSATISSSAVTEGVNAVCARLLKLIEEGR
ncbi:MAG: FMN-binding protein [Clostridia bacterium]|nr:FMN-binding protein [Clostridia bacterium]